VSFEKDIGCDNAEETSLIQDARECGSLLGRSHSWGPVSGSAAHEKWSGGAQLFGLFSKLF